MSTISDVARRAGVSTMTVSRVVNNSGYTSQETRQRVEKAIAELGYVPNALARSLRFKQTNTIALLLTDITNPFFATIARGVEDVAGQHGFSVLLCNTDESETKERAYLNSMLRRQVDGVLLVPASGSSESIALLQARSVPVVVLDRRVTRGAADCVRCDSDQAAYQLIRHLLDLGHTRIALLSGPTTVSTALDRQAGYERAIAEAGLAIDRRLIQCGELNPAASQRTVQRMLAVTPRPTAIFAANQLLASGAFRAVRAAGLRIPEDISLVTCDDLPQQLLMEPFLTMVAQPAYELGRRAAALLLDRLAGEGPAEPQDLLLPTELIVRTSSAPPAAVPRL